jgi:hypothetical protein
MRWERRSAPKMKRPPSRMVGPGWFRRSPSDRGWGEGPGSGTSEHPLASRVVQLAVVTLLLGLFLATNVENARAGAAFGVRGGYSDVDGAVFRGSGALHGRPFFGLQAVLPLTTGLGLILAGEARNDTLRFDQAGLEGSLFQGKGKWEDTSLHASLRLRLIPLAAGLSGIYVGAGAGVHFTKTRIQEYAVAAVPRSANPGTGRTLRSAAAPRSTAADPINDFIKRAEKDQTQVSYHGLAGISLGFPGLPLSIFGEARYEDMQGDYRHQGYLAYAGLNLELP